MDITISKVHQQCLEAHKTNEIQKKPIEQFFTAIFFCKSVISNNQNKERAGSKKKSSFFLKGHLSLGIIHQW